MSDDRDAYGSETYGHGEVKNYIEPRRPRGPSDAEEYKSARARLWKRVALAALTVSLVLVVSLGAYNAYAIRQQQAASSVRLKAIQHGAHDAHRATVRIEECTTPGRPCFRQGQKRTAAMVGEFDDSTARASAAAAACAARGERKTYREILACVTHVIAERSKAKHAR